MSSSVPTPLRRFRVDDLVVDVGTASVTRNGAPVALPPLSFDLLVALAESAPDLVSTEQLMQQVWRGTVVSPETVGQRVKLLRDALGDDPREPRYVAVVRGRGYRLVPRVVAADDEPEVACEATVGTPADRDDAIAPAAPPTAPHGVLGTVSAPSRMRRMVVIGVTAVALLAIALWSTTSRDRTRIDAATDADGSRAAGTAAPDARARSALPAGADRSESTTRTVAVLPFQNLSADPGNDFIGLGVAEMVLNRLAASGALSVVARSSSFAFEKQHVDAREIGRQLGAEYLVQGGVQRAGDRVRVTAQLVDAASGRHLRVLQFDRTVHDLFALQDEIADGVARSLDVAVSPPTVGTRVPDAHIEYLRGLAALGRWNERDALQAVRHFQSAQQLDPAYAPPYVGEAEALRLVVTLRRESLEALKPTLAKLADRALALDPDLGSAYVVRALLASSRTDAERDLRKGIALAPNYGEGYFRLATQLLAEPSRRTEALELLDRAVAVDPMRPRYRLIQAGEQFRDDRDVNAMRSRLLEVLRLDPGFVNALQSLSRWIAIYGGEFAEAVGYAERALALEPDSDVLQQELANLYFAIGDPDAALAVPASRASAHAVAIGAAMFRGDTRRAAQLAATPVPPRAGAAAAPPRSASPLDTAILAALVDGAARTGDYASALRVVRDQRCRDAGEYCLSETTIPDALALGELLLRSGDRRAAEAQLTRLLDWAARERKDHARPYFVMAKANALLGRRAAALAAVDSIARGPKALSWWVLLVHDRAFDSIRDEPRFQAALASARAHAADERRKVEAMRRAGQVPERRPRDR